MKRLQQILILACLLVLAPLQLWAQDNIELPKPRPVDPAYEGLITSAKLLTKNEALQKGLAPGAKLSDKQDVLDDPKVKQSLENLTRWLDMNALPTQELSYGLEGFDSLFTQFGAMTQLANALAVKQYVMLAEGHVGDAIDTTRDSLRLAVSLQNHSMAGCLEGFAIEDIVVLPLAKHLDQLSSRDCTRLLRLAQDWDRTPNAILFALGRERRAGAAMMMKFAGEDGKKLRAMLKQIPPDAVKPDSDEGRMLSQIKSLDEDGWKQLMTRAANGVDQMYSKAVQDVQTPVYKRGAPQKIEATKDLVGNIEGVIASAFTGQLEKLQTGYAQRQAYAHLLGCHAAIHQFQWENNRLPVTLKELNLHSIATDPFSGNELVYKLDKEGGYTLESVGPMVYDKDGKEKPSERKPISLQMKDAPALIPGLTAPAE